MENERMKCRLMEGEAEDYIKSHKIMELFKNMTALLLYHRPGRNRLRVDRFPVKSSIEMYKRRKWIFDRLISYFRFRDA